jgi:hypothetical protein
MKYILLYGSTKEGQQQWENMPEDIRRDAYKRIMKWFEENGSRIESGYELQSPTTATTVRHQENGDEPIVTDGPFIEGNEVIGGYSIVNVPDLDEALRLAKTWPGWGTVEVRPVVER